MSKSIRRRLLAVAATGALLSACTTVGPNFTAPDAPQTTDYVMPGDAAPAGLTMSPDTRAAGPWWNALGSAELDRTIRLALADSPSVLEATAAIERANADLASARGRQGVIVEGDARAERERINTRTFGFTGFPSPTIDVYSVGGTISYDLDLFGGQRRAAEGAQARLEAETHRADAAYLTLSGNVAIQAVQIAGLNAQIDTINAVIAADRSRIDMVRRAEAAGGAAPSAATAGEAQLAQDQALLPPLQRDLAAARHQLALLVGKAPADWTAPNFTLADFNPPGALPVSVPSQFVRQRPDIQAAEAELHTLTAQIGVATANLYPDITLNVGLAQTALTPEDLFDIDSSGWNIGPSIEFPIFNRSGPAQRDVAVANAKAGLARYQGTVLRAFVQVADSLTALAHEQNEIDALSRAETTNRATLGDAQKAYDLGGGPLIAVVDAQRQVGLVQRQIVQARGRLMENLVRFYAASGAGAGA